MKPRQVLGEAAMKKIRYSKDVDALLIELSDDLATESNG
jgi:hypothetical protein